MYNYDDNNNNNDNENNIFFFYFIKFYNKFKNCILATKKYLFINFLNICF